MNTLAAGQWLGTRNQIMTTQHTRKGWQAKDSTGAYYYQSSQPDGLETADDPYGEKVMTPWPDNPKETR